MGSEENQWVDRVDRIGKLVGWKVDFVGIEGRGFEIGMRDKLGVKRLYVCRGFSRRGCPSNHNYLSFYYYLNYFVTQTINLTNYSAIKYFDYRSKFIINKKREELTSL